MEPKITSSKSTARAAASKAPAKVAQAKLATAAGKAAASKFRRDEMSTGRASAHRAAARQAIGAHAADPVDQAFDRKIAALKRAVANGVPGAQAELDAVLHDRHGVQAAIADLEKKIAANDDPAAWAKVKPRSLAQAEQADVRAQLKKQLHDLKEFGVKVAGMNPKERQDLQNFFRLAKEDPAAFKRFVDGVSGKNVPPPVSQTGPVAQTSGTDAPANIQTAIDFGLSQLGAPYVGGASPFRFGTPGDGRTYQMEGQHAYVSPKGVIGYDCSGLMVTMLKKAGIDISRFSSSRSMKANLPQVPKDQLQPGDLLVKNGHVAMYIGDGKMIEAVPGGVKVSPASKYINDPAYTGHHPG